MKFTMKIGVLLLSLFLLASCGKTIDDVEDLIPTISIVGDDVITIEQYTVFTDPGATIPGDFDIPIHIDTDLDTSVLGDYTFTYSIVYEGVTYEETRIVRVIAPVVPVDFEWVYNTVSVSTDTISVFVSFTDTDEMLVDGKGSLYQGDALVRSFDLLSGDNYLNYSGLQSNMEYTFVIEGSYDDNGTTVELDDLELSITTAEQTTMVFSLSNEETTHNAYSANITIDYASNNINTTIAYLYLGEALVKEMVMTSPTTAFSVDGLLPDTEYVLQVVYTATPSDGGAVETFTEVLKTFSTNTLPAPEFVTLLCTPGFYGFECAVGVNETGLTDVALRFEVWKDGAYHSLFHVTNSNTYVNITDLEPGTEYTLKLYTDYKVAGSDDLIAYTLLHTETFTTEDIVTYTAPFIDNLVITKVLGSTNSVTFDFDLNDPDDVIDGNIWLRMYRGGSQTVEAVTLGHNTITFEGYPVYANTLYTLKITTDYQQDEDTFVYDQVIHEEDFLMPPEVEVSSYTLQKSMYFHSDRIVLILELDNDEDLNVEYVTINGTKIYKEDFLFPSNTHTIYLNMGVETDYTDYYYHLTNYAVTVVDDSSYVLEYDETLTFRLQQPGDIDPDDAEVGVLEITADDYTRATSAGAEDFTTISIHLDNEYNLDVHSISIGGVVYLSTSFNEDSTAKVINLQVEVDRYDNLFSITDLVFIRNDEQVTADSSNYNVSPINIFGYYIEDSIVISSAAELNSIDPSANKYYYLSQDLDLTGFPMNPIGTNASPFSGVFDGNGHTISNLTLTSLEADQNTDVYLGLFGKSTGSIYNLIIFNSSITVVTDETHTLHVGTLLGSTSGTIMNVTSLGTNTISITGMTQGYVGGLAGTATGFVRDASSETTITIDGLSIDTGSSYSTYVGGLFGTAGEGNIETSSSNGTISITNTVNNTNLVGGLIGRYYNSSSDYATRNYILYSYASVDIYTSNHGDGSAGGLVGTINNNYADNTEIKNSYASGDIYSDRGYIGGLVGESWVYITNSFATGNIDRIDGYADRFASYGSDTFYTNNYVYDIQTVSTEGVPGFISEDIEGRIVTASIDEYNSEDFYTEVLNWSTYFWDFDSLFVTADILPEHN